PTFYEPSLLPCLRDRSACPEIAVSQLARPGWAGLRSQVGYTGSIYRLLEEPVSRTAQLCELARDPYEQRDLAASRPDVVRRMRAAVRRWESRSVEPGPQIGRAGTAPAFARTRAPRDSTRIGNDSSVRTNPLGL